MKTLKEIIQEVEKTVRCNCDLDNWQPQIDSGHSCVCRIDRIARERLLNEGIKARRKE